LKHSAPQGAGCGGSTGGSGTSQPAASRHAFNVACTSSRHTATSSAVVPSPLSSTASRHAWAAVLAAAWHSSPQTGGCSGLPQPASVRHAFSAACTSSRHARTSSIVPPVSLQAAAASVAILKHSAPQGGDDLPLRPWGAAGLPGRGRAARRGPPSSRAEKRTPWLPRPSNLCSLVSSVLLLFSYLCAPRFTTRAAQTIVLRLRASLSSTSFRSPHKLTPRTHATGTSWLDPALSGDLCS